MIAPDTHILIHAANSGSVLHGAAREFLKSHAANPDFALCELNLIELYMALRNPAVFSKPLKAAAAQSYCLRLKANRKWQILDYSAAVTPKLWDWAAKSKSGFRRIIDARIALTLLHHGVTEFATVNIRDFREFGFQRVWNPLAA